MGGCRCTYRNCTVKSDGKTHMFHYPVFEKVRCYQWLLNAHRLDFLNLKVSQLKNRVVCQHHFKDESFMNFKKDKLTFDAIPTENGPYCDPSKFVVNLDSSKLFPIIIDDTENDYIMGNDKKANYSLKYGDFLANLDLMDIEKINNESMNYLNDGLALSPHKNKGKGRLISADGSFVFNISLPDKSEKKCLTQPTVAVSPYIGSTGVFPCRGTGVMHNESKNYHHVKFKNDNVSTIINQSNLVGNVTNDLEPNQLQKTVVKKEPKIKIISEKKITNPVPITGKFESVTPNFVLDVSTVCIKSRKKNAASVVLQNNKSIENKACSVQETSDKIEIELEPLFKEEDISKSPQHTTVNLFKNKIVSEKACKVSHLKPKVPLEKVEAINKKRKFNMKLRDMVETCLDKLENCDKAIEKTKPENIINTKPKINKRRAHHATSLLSKNAPIPSTQEYTYAFLEERMKKMENTLLEKIDQNSKTIVELKQAFVKASQEKKSVVLSRADEETHKKQLFQEISKYLSSNSKSFIYEELFIKNVAVNETKPPPQHKRRRCT